MSNAQKMGTATVLDPPLEIDGTPYSLAIRFRSSPEYTDAQETIVSGVIHSVSDNEDGTFDVVCRRSYVSFSYTEAGTGDIGGREIIYGCLCGGNIAHTPEPLRFYTRLSPLAVRGSVRHIRAIPGDMMWVDSGGIRQGFYVKDVFPMQQAPTTIRYAHDTPQPILHVFRLDFADIALPVPDRTDNPDAEVELLDTGFFHDAGLFIDSTKLTRKIFVGPSGAGEDYYPDGATLAQGEFWINPATYEIRLASLNENLGTEMDAVYYESGIESYTSEVESLVVIEGEGDGYDDTGTDDATVGVAWTTRNDATPSVFLYPNTDGGTDYGEGAIEWHFPNEGLKAAVTWSGNAINGFYARTSPTGGMASLSYSAVTFAAGIETITVEKTGNVIEFRRDTDVIGSVTLGTGEDAVFQKSFGLFGPRAWGGNQIKAYPVGAGTEFQKTGLGGNVYVRRVETFTDLEYSKTYELQNDAAVDEAVSLTDQGAYSQNNSVPRARSRYSRSGREITFYSETAPDVVQVTIEAPDEVPEGDRVPRITWGVDNLATADTGTVEPTQSNDENRANHSDVLRVVAHEEGTFPFLGGTNFDIRRDAVLDPEASWTLRADIYNDAGDWATVPTADIHARPAEGVFLISEDWVDANAGAGETTCFRLDADFVIHDNLPARAINELGDAIEVFDSLQYADTPSGVTSSDEVGGWMQAEGFGPSSWACVDQSGNGIFEAMVMDLALGVSRESWEFWADLLTYANLSFAEKYNDPSTGGPGAVIADESGDGAKGYTSTANNVFTTCNEDNGNGYDLSSFTVDTRLIYSWPWGGVPDNLIPASFNGFGAIPSTATFALEPTYFQFAGLAFGIPPSLTRALATASVVNAWLEVKFDGIENIPWTLEVSGLWGRTPNIAANNAGDILDAYSAEIRVDGTLAYEWDSVAQAPVSRNGGFDALKKTSADIAYNLVGRRKASDDVFFRLSYEKSLKDIEDAGGTPTSEQKANFRDGNTLNLDGGDWRVFGSGVSVGGSVPSGEWAVIDVTGAVRGFMSARESEYRDFQLFPTRTGVDLDSSAGSIASYLKSIEPSTSLSTSVSDKYVSYTFTASGQQTKWENMTVGRLVIQLEHASGTLSNYVCPPIIRPRLA